MSLPSSRRRSLWLLLLLATALLVACTPTAAPVALPTPLPTLPATLPEQRALGGVLLVSLDGVPPDELHAALATDSLPTLSHLAARGFHSALAPVAPTLPESAAATLLSAQPPNEHGWVGLPGSPPLPAFWTEERDLYSVLVGPWPDAGPGLADAGVSPGEQLSESALHEPALAPAQAWQGAPPSFSPRLEARLPLPRPVAGVEALWLLAVDTLNDSVVAYDQYWLAPQRQLDPESVPLDARVPGWTSLTLGEQAAVHLLLLDGDAERLRLYQSPVVTTRLWPADIVTRWPAPLGFFPPDPDVPAYQQGWLSAEQLAEMGSRQQAWLAEASAWLWATTPAGQRPLVATRWPAVGHLMGALLLVDPAQPGWQQGRQQQLQGVRAQALVEMDRALARLLSEVDLSQHALVLTVPLGIEPLRHTISLPALAQAAGLAIPESEMVVQGSGAWLRLPDALSVASVEAALTRVTEPGDPQPLVEAVVGGESIAGTAAGWLWLRARSGYSFSLRREGGLVQPSGALGGWGGSERTPALHGWGLVVGRGVRAAPPGAEPLPLTDFATVPAQLLGLSRFAGQPAPLWLDRR